MRHPIAAPAAAILLLLSFVAIAPAATWPTRPEDRAARAALAATHGGRVAKVARENEGGATWEAEVWLPKRRKVDVLLDSRYRVMNVSNEQDPGETPAGLRAAGVTGARAEQIGRQKQLAARAAAKAVGGGILLDVDREPVQGATWEVEFMKLNGTKVNVLLDDRYRAVKVTRGKYAN
jgi:hypothetical protein